MGREAVREREFLSWVLPGGAVLALLALLPGVVPGVQLLSALLLCLTVPGLVLVPAPLLRDPVTYWTLVLTSSALVNFLAGLILLYAGAFTRLALFLLVAWLTGLVWTAARWSAPSPSARSRSAQSRSAQSQDGEEPPSGPPTAGKDG